MIPREGRAQASTTGSLSLGHTVGVQGAEAVGMCRTEHWKEGSSKKELQKKKKERTPGIDTVFPFSLRLNTKLHIQEVTQGPKTRVKKSSWESVINIRGHTVLEDI